MSGSGNKDVYHILTDIVNFSDDAIVTKTLDGIITSWNRGAEKIFGYKAAEIIGKHISILIPPEKLEEEPEILRKIARGEFVDHYETNRVRKDGSRVHISLTLSPTKDPDGNVMGILKIARDITVRRKAEEIQARMADIINLSDDAIITKTLQGIVTSWNHGAEKIFGYSKQEVIGKNVSLLIPPGKRDEEPEIIEKVSKGNYINHYETQRLRKDGTLVHISLSVSPIKDSSGAVTGILKIARDVTLRQEAEETQRRLASIINFSDDGIVSKNLDGIITSWNAGAEKIFGYSSEEVIGKPITIIIPPEKLHEEPEILRKIRSGEYIHHYVTDRVRKDGSIVHISLTVSPIKDRNGKVTGISKIARDITEQKKKEMEIKFLNQELEAFNYSVAHDLRSPLRSILNYSQMLQERYGPVLEQDGGQIIERIIRKSQRMDVLIHDLLMLSRLGRKELHKTDIDVESMVREIVDELKAQSNLALPDIRFRDLGHAYGDKSLLKQVWENLISNAIKYSRKKDVATIEIGTTTANNSVTYYIKDNGVGFDMKYADKLFSPFQRLHNTSDYEGTGIGLAIVQQIISKHGGNTWAEGKAGEGATFYFSLPAPTVT
jgi:PAS domain S-box-containing protein